MKRAEYNEYLYIRSSIRQYRKEGRKPIMWHIRIDYSAELKQKIDSLLREFGFYPCSLQTPSFLRGDGDFIIYIPYKDEADWLTLTTDSERAAVEAAIRQ